MRCGCIILCSLIFIGAALTGSARGQGVQEGDRLVPEIKATRINPHAPVIDGNLDDPVWTSSKVTFVRDFTQRYPNEGAAPSESTLVAVVYDDHAVYFALKMFDSQPDGIIRQLVRRDRWSESDYIAVRLDPYHDHQTGYGFDVSAANVQRDYRIYNDNNTDDSWDGVWESAVRVYSWGWVVEMCIPYHCLRFEDRQTHTWGVDFARSHPRTSETMRWAYTPSSMGGFASNFGHLTNLQGVKPARHLEVLPYTVARLETEPKDVGNTDGRDALGNTGVDIKYGISSNLTLDATVNPDFGQVELDRPVLNLSSFETFFPERRPFFVEGANLFSTRFDLFYSRRVGRSPWRGINDDEGEYYTDYPDATTILGAAKLTGKLGGRTSIAVLTAITDEERAKYVTYDGENRNGVVEPYGMYSVFRVKQDLFRRSSIGAMLTNAGQESLHPSTTGGVDWRLFTNNGAWSTTGQVVFSRNDGQNTGLGYDVTINKESGEHFRGAIGLTVEDTHLDLNRLGYLGRNDEREVWSWVQYRTTQPWWIIQRSSFNLNAWTGWNGAGDDIERGGNFNFWMDLVNHWGFGGGVSVQGEKYSDVETRGNGLWQWPVYPTYSYWLNVD
ncbi:MAG: carbohydrate binding family 9 domain-containing protein, partial [candidate division Zixibacteria bacterium]|nr:carbohydrate binding family 9 domain-containing protein [candidate division Zixibacteria bacterium]